MSSLGPALPGNRGASDAHAGPGVEGVEEEGLPQGSAWGQHPCFLFCMAASLKMSPLTVPVAVFVSASGYLSVCHCPRPLLVFFFPSLMG